MRLWQALVKKKQEAKKPPFNHHSLMPQCRTMLLGFSQHKESIGGKWVLLENGISQWSKGNSKISFRHESCLIRKSYVQNSRNHIGLVVCDMIHRVSYELLLHTTNSTDKYVHIENKKIAFLQFHFPKLLCCLWKGPKEDNRFFSFKKSISVHPSSQKLSALFACSHLLSSITKLPPSQNKKNKF